MKKPVVLVAALVALILAAGAVAAWKLGAGRGGRRRGGGDQAGPGQGQGQGQGRRGERNRDRQRPEPRPAVALPQSAGNPADGCWAMNIDGKPRGQVDLVANGETLVGNLTNHKGKVQAIADGKVHGNDFEFKMPRRGFDATAKGKIENGELHGTITASGRTFPLVAKRCPPGGVYPKGDSPGAPAPAAAPAPAPAAAPAAAATPAPSAPAPAK